MSKENSFTLIELLVVIAIIGLLSTVVLVVVGPVRGKARDATRREDLSQIRLALELYHSQYEVYPSTGALGTLWAEGKCSNPPPEWGWVIKPDYSGNNAYIPGLAPEFIGSLPGDPAVNGVNGRCYGYSSDGQDYFVWTHFGVEGPYSSDDPIIRLTSASGCTQSQNTFVVSNTGKRCW